MKNKGIAVLQAKATIELATFRLGDAVCAIDILLIQEINKRMDYTWVPHSPDYVKGVLNLRGRIVTVIDLGIKLGLHPIIPNAFTRNIIVHSNEEFIGLLVEDIRDIIQTETDQIEAPPANIGDVEQHYFNGVLATVNQLIGILNIDEILKTDEGFERMS